MDFEAQLAKFNYIRGLMFMDFEAHLANPCQNRLSLLPHFTTMHVCVPVCMRACARECVHACVRACACACIRTVGRSVGW